MPTTPEDLARQRIDVLLRAAGWQVQNRQDANLAAGRGVAVREFPMKKGHGEADYPLFVDGAAAGAIEAKKEVETSPKLRFRRRSTARGFQTASRLPGNRCRSCTKAQELRPASPIYWSRMPTAVRSSLFVGLKCYLRGGTASLGAPPRVLAANFGVCPRVPIT
jgi:hypothetical protein